MGMDYLKEGESETAADGTFIEKTEAGTIVHNTPKEDKFIIKNTVMENWIKKLEENKDSLIKMAGGKDILLKDAILSEVVSKCSKQWNIDETSIRNCLNTIFLTPRYSSIISEPTLNNSEEECLACAKVYTKINSVSLERLLYSIEAFHCCGKYIGHPWIELHGDGSGRVIGRFNDELFKFSNLKELASMSADNMKEMTPEKKEEEDLQMSFSF